MPESSTHGITLSNLDNIMIQNNTTFSGDADVTKQDNIDNIRKFLCVSRDGLPIGQPNETIIDSTCNLTTNLNKGIGIKDINVALLKAYGEKLLHNQQVSLATVGASATLYENQQDFICKIRDSGDLGVAGSTSPRYFSPPACHDGAVSTPNSNISSIGSCTCCEGVGRATDKANSICSSGETQVNKVMDSMEEFCKYLGKGTSICGEESNNASETHETLCTLFKQHWGVNSVLYRKTNAKYNCDQYVPQTPPTVEEISQSGGPPQAHGSSTPTPSTSTPSTRPSRPSTSFGGFGGMSLGSTAPTASAATFPPGPRTMWIGIVCGLGAVLALIMLRSLIRRKSHSDADYNDADDIYDDDMMVTFSAF